MAKVLVTGGTGFVGREVVKQLHALGYQVRLLARPSRAGKALVAKYGFETVPGDIGDVAAVEAACQGIDVVIHLVGIIVEKGKQTYQKVHVEGTEHVVRAAEKAGVKRYIHMSALSERHHSGAHVSDYHRTKSLAEGIVRRSTLQWTIFRPSVIFGAGDGFVNQLAGFLKFPFNALQLWSFPLFGGGKTLLQPVAVTDVAAAFARAISHADSVGKTYDLVGPERLSLSEILQEIASATGQESVTEGYFPKQLLTRSLIWGAVALLPLLLIVAAVVGYLVVQNAAQTSGGSPIELVFRAPGGAHVPVSLFFVALILVWIGFVIAALRSKRIIFFAIPWPAAFTAGAVLGLLPKPPLTLGQVFMLQQDNVGEAAPAVETFGLHLKGFREGIREYVY